MKITWNNLEKRFETTVSPANFENDLTCLKKAGWRTTGAPLWIWYAVTVKCLEKLRKDRPTSGLTILQDALQHFNTLRLQNEKNNEIKKKLRDARKEAKEVRQADQDNKNMILCPEGFLSWNVPYGEPVKLKIAVPASSSVLCLVCQQPIYYYEQQTPPLCIWCEILSETFEKTF